MNKVFRFGFLAFLLCLSVVLPGCGGGGGGGSDSGGAASPVGTAGSAGPAAAVMQKGPFALGSQIYIYELNDRLNATGNVYTTQTIDDLGNFSLASVPASVRYVEIVGDGFYLDEVTGQLSAARILLRAVEDIKSHPNVSVNVLTTLQAPRIKALVQSGSTFEDAFAESQNQVLAVFGITSAAVRTTSMRINGSTDSDAILLATSAILLKMAHDASANQLTVPAQLSSFLEQIASDMSTDGTLNDAATISAKANAAQSVDLVAVRNNVQNYYAGKGLSFQAPGFEEWVDNDGSGLLPKRRSVAPTDFSFAPVSDAQAFTVYTSETIVVSGLGGTYAAARTGSNGTIVKNGVALAGRYTTVVDGDNIALRTTSAGFGKTKTATLTIGNTARDFTITTRMTQIRLTYGFQYHSLEWPYRDRGSKASGDQTGPYYAVPIRTSDAFTARYIGIGVEMADSTIWQGTRMSGPSISICTDDAGKPGSVLATASALGQFFEDMDYSSQPRALTWTDRSNLNQNWQAYFGAQGVALSGATNYWIVIRYAFTREWEFVYYYQTNGSNCYQGCDVLREIVSVPTLPHSSMLYSADGSSWSQFTTFQQDQHHSLPEPNVGPAIYISD